ncbi:hypothetical protein PsAD2_02382 [Pseudovibrio axinellae]|uniref:DUF1499 domain-containing protein n=1 Tax=Pseudovibrio axinellae TaxID=989403 RepID=A0A165YIB4_9HYPH|nr:DUF1499 domain-containing protein [Pseudovibrio axinellae]KZL18866.1 hypothetical protein PsAD2_02382 [Pseudovibrio axinellae]SEP89752.1 Protein of unknown function [Pseudovibrio axinellae]
MTLQLPLRHSRTAMRGRRVGAIAIPFLVLSVVGHYFELYDTEALLVLFVLGFFMGATAIVLALIAVVDLWKDGGTGFTNTFLGTFYGIIVLLPLFMATVGLYMFPPLNDISTDMNEPPSLIASDRIGDEVAQDKKLMQKASYPDIVPRRFRLPPPELHNAVSSVAANMGWKVLSEVSAGFPDEPTYLLMEARMPYFSLKDDVAIRIQPDRVGTLLDIRSASRFGSHDFGTNARRIRGFLASLDLVLLQNYGTTARVEEPELVVQETGTPRPPRTVNNVPLLEAPLELPPSIASVLRERGSAPVPSQKPAE